MGKVGEIVGIVVRDYPNTSGFGQESLNSSDVWNSSSSHFEL